jgi:hypothetical protein
MNVMIVHSWQQRAAIGVDILLTGGGPQAWRAFGHAAAGDPDVGYRNGLQPVTGGLAGA